MMSSQSFDWDGVGKWEDGKLVGFVNKSAYNNWSIKPIPQDEQAIAEAKQTKAIVDKLLQPPSYDYFAQMYKAMTLNYNHQDKSEKEMSMYASMWWADIGSKYPQELILQAFRDIRRTSQQFMPKIGEVIERVEKPYKKLKELERKANLVLGIEEQKELSLIEQLNNIGL